MALAIGCDRDFSSWSLTRLSFGSSPNIVCSPVPAGSTSASTTLRPSCAKNTAKLTAKRLLPAPPGPPATLITRGLPFELMRSPSEGGALSTGGSPGMLLEEADIGLGRDRPLHRAASRSSPTLFENRSAWHHWSSVGG